MSLAGSVSDAENKSQSVGATLHLEMQLHHKAVFTTLTYSNEHLPPTLDRKHLGGFVKRLRDRLARSEPGRTIRFFGCGEYGTRTKRPHYHALLFGVAEHEGKTVQAAWDFGHTVTEKITPERIAYCAGYTAKKYGDENRYETWRMPDGIGRRKSPVGSTAKPVNTWYANPTRKGHGNQKSPGIGNSPSCR